MAKTRKGTLDFETDPFKFERVPVPFASCIYFDDLNYSTIWSPKCAELTFKALLELPKCELYAHNGGKFDFWFLVPFIESQDIKIINGRIAKMQIGNVTLIDSYLLIAEPLAKYKKTKISYAKLEKESRLEHKREIIRYMIDDCSNLLELVNGFHKILGKKLTIGSAAIKSIKDNGIKVEQLGSFHDSIYREFFHGGRVQVFEQGHFTFSAKKPAKLIDINSAYAFAMTHKHPKGTKYKESRRLPKPRYKNGQHVNGHWFAEIEAISRGALPLKMDNNELHFPDNDSVHTFHATGWEIQNGLDTGTLEIIRIHQVLQPAKTICFKPFVNHHYGERQKAKADGDLLRDLVHKKAGNSGYGKFATNPEKFYEWCIAEIGQDVHEFAGGEDYEWYNDVCGKSLWRRPASPEAKEAGYYDVATAASVTGFVRAMLWRVLCQVDRPLYCDTDSVFCAGHSLTTSGELGHWKHEMDIHEAHIIAKKLYALRGKIPGKSKPVKKFASKGARMRYADIVALWNRGTRTWKNAAPTFSIFRGVHFVARELKVKLE
jgi:hypothetical protein